MSFALADLRTDLNNLLATAGDPQRRHTLMLDEACRQALQEYNEQVVYEVSFTVTVTGEEQDISSITDLNQVLSVAWPWSDGEDFTSKMRPWRYKSDQTIYFDEDEPQSGDAIRVRYTKLHKVNNLDSAVSTTVPNRHQRVLSLLAAKWACVFRLRQTTELGPDATELRAGLREAIEYYDDQARHCLNQIQTHQNPRWGDVGL